MGRPVLLHRPPVGTPGVQNLWVVETILRSTKALKVERRGMGHALNLPRFLMPGVDQARNERGILDFGLRHGEPTPERYGS